MSNVRDNNNQYPAIRFAGFTDPWVQRKLGDVADRYDNLRVPITAANRIAGSTPYYGANGIQDFVDGFTHDGEFILVAEDGASDFKNYPIQHVRGKVWVNNHAHVLQTKKDVADNKFLMNELKNVNIEPFLVGGGRAKLNADVMMKLPISLPGVQEQQAIGLLVEAIDTLITANQQKDAKLREMKKLLLQRMFVSGDAEVPDIRFAGFTDPWVQRKFFDNVKNVLDFRGRTPLKLGMEWSKSGYLALSALNVKNGYIDVNQDAHYGGENLYQKWMGNVKLVKGDVLFTTEAPMGNVAQVPDGKGYLLSQRIIALQTDDDVTDSTFFAQYLRSPQIQNTLNSVASGGTAKGVSQKTLTPLKTVVPNDVREQKEIGKFLERMDVLITANQKKGEKLQEMKKLLLQQMFV